MTRSYPFAAHTNARAMPVLPDVDSTIVFRPGSMRPSASAASIIATPIRSLTLPAGLYASSFPISSAPQSGATRVSPTIGVLPTRSARLSGISFVGGETLICRREYLAICQLLTERDERHADDRGPVSLGAHTERDLTAADRPLRCLHERDLEDLVGAVVHLRVRELRLDLGDRRADPDAACPRPAGDGDIGHPAWARLCVVDAALQRRAEPRRARVLGELAPGPDRANLAACT